MSVALSITKMQRQHMNVGSGVVLDVQAALL